MATNSVSAATNAGTGVGGSVLDVQGLVSQLIAADRAPFDQQIKTATTRVTTQISALGTLKGALSDFQTALDKLKSTDSATLRAATTSQDAGFTASATGKASAGSYSIEVTKLAQAQQIASGPFASGPTQTVGTGSLTLSVAGQSFTVDIDSAHSALQDIRDAINDASGNPGIQATLINSADGSRLVLTSSSTGAASAISVVGSGALTGLNYSNAVPGSYTVLAAAQDAVVKVAGFTVTSASNTLSNAIDGVTLNLTAAAPGNPHTLSITNDTKAVTAEVQSFVTAYNALATQIAKLRSYDAGTQTAGPMLGDSLVTGLESQIRRTLSSAVSGISGPYQTLSSIGVATQADGTLALSPSKLENALDADFNSVGNLFSGPNGVATQLDGQISTTLESGGAIEARSKRLIQQQSDISDQQNALDDRMTKLQETYLQQFTALDTLLSSLQTTSAYLSQQIANLPKPFNNSG